MTATATVIETCRIESAKLITLIDRTLARGDESATRLLRAVAIVGSDWIPAAQARAVGEISDPTAAIDDLVEAGLLRTRVVDGVVEVGPTAAVLPALVCERTPMAMRRSLHRQAALVASGVDEVLRHRAAATLGRDDDLAAELLARGWERYEQRRFGDAARLVGWSCRLARDPAVRERRWLDSLFMSTLAGALATVVKQIGLVERASDLDRSALLVGMAHVLQGRYLTAVAVLSGRAGDALPAADDVDAALVRYRIEAVLAWAVVAGGLPDELAMAGIGRAARLAVRDVNMSVHLDRARLILQWRRNGLDAALTRGHSALTDDSSGGLLQIAAGHFDRAVEDLQVRQSEARSSRRLDIAEGAADALLATSYWFAGRWELARLNFALAVPTADAVTSMVVAASLPLDSAGRGEFDDADRLLRIAEQKLTQVQAPESIGLFLLSSVVRLHADDQAAGRRAELLPSVRAHWPRFIAVADRLGPVVLLHAVQAAIWSGDLDLAGSWVGRIEAGTEPAGWTRAAALWLRGLIADHRGDPREALRLLRASAAAESSSMPLLRAHLLADQARLEASAGDRRRSAAVAAEALMMYRKLGAQPYLDRPRPVTTPESTDPIGLDAPIVAGSPALEALSDREREVTALLLRGLSMAQIARTLCISASTVSFHLGRIYAKTGIHSRHELTATLRREAAL